MSIVEFLEQYGSWAGLIIYILLTDVIPFIKDKYWPAVQAEKEENRMLRRESDLKLLDLEERRVIANETVAKNLILLTQKTTNVEVEIRRHDDHMATVISQMTNTLSSMQAINNILLDRVTRPHITADDLIQK